MSVLMKCSKRVLVLALALFAQGTWALGLGELHSESRLNEPLVATIEILGAEGLGEDEVVVRIAKQEDFDRLGVSRDFILTSLLFAVDLDAKPTVIRVSTMKPVQEPSLNFVLEIQTPKIRLLKEYTIFLTPAM